MKKTLKHYQRKKRFYRLFMLDSPRSAGLTTFNAAFNALLLKPFVLLAAAAAITKFTTTTAIVFAFFALWWLAMTIIAFAIPIASGKRPKKQKSSWKSKEFYLKHWEFIFIFAAIFVLYYCRFNYFSIIIAFAAITAFFVMGENPEPLKKRAVAFMIFDLFFIFLIAFLSYLSDDFIHDTAIRITKLTGRDVTVDGYLAREKKAFQFNREPLKSLIDAYPQHDPDLIYDILDSPLEAKKKLLQYEKKYPVFTQSAKKFAAVPLAQYGIGNKINKSKSLFDAKLFSGEMRETARYFAWQMQCFPADKKLIAECNQSMCKIRDFCFNSNTLIYHLTGCAVESMRLQALVSTLKFNDINEAEFDQLLGGKIDFSEYFRHSFADELTHMESLKKYLLSTPNLPFNEKSYDFLRKNIPHHLKIYLALNYAVFAQKIENIINISQSELSESEKLAELKKNDENTGLLLCDMFGPTADNTCKRFVQTEELRTIAAIAFKIIDHHRKYGKLPENLNFLPTIPVDSIYGKKLRYETGNIKLYNTDENTFNGFVLAVDEYQKYNKYSYCRIIVKNH